MIQSAVRHRTIEWGNEEASRLCGMIMESNYGIVQEIISNQTTVLDTLSYEQLASPDDLGITPIYQAIYYNRPKIVIYLNQRGIDMSKPCDPANYGNPMFYAVTMHRSEIVDILDRLGYRVTDLCDCLDQLPLNHAKRIDDREMIDVITRCEKRPQKVAELFYKNYLKQKNRRQYLRIRNSIITLQAFIRGFLLRNQRNSSKKDTKFSYDYNHDTG